MAAQRAEIFDKTVAKVTKDYFDPKFNGVDWPKLARERRDGILSLSDSEAFELAMHDLLRSLWTSHTGFSHQSVRRVPARLAIGATFGKAESEAGPAWIAWDVHDGGPAHVARLRPLDVLKAINGSAITPPNQPMFPMGVNASLLIQRGSEDLTLTGHLGGGLGVLRLMSHLTPDKLPIGFTLTGKIAESAGEMVAAFALENGLATLIGVETAGRLILGSGFKVGHGYMLIMPEAQYITWQGHRFEGAGVKPEISVSWSVESFVAGDDFNVLWTTFAEVRSWLWRQRPAEFVSKRSRVSRP